MIERVRRHGLGILLAASVPLAGVAEERVRAGNERILRLMERSGAWAQLAQLEPQAIAGLDQMRRGAKGGLGGDEAEALESAVREAFSAERLRARMGEELAATLDLATIQTALAWLESDLGRRITGFEEQATSVTGGDHQKHLGPKLLAAAGQERRALFERLATAIDAGEVMYSISSTVAAGIFRGLAIASPHLNLDPDLMKRQLAAERATIVAEAEKEARSGFAYTYRELAEEELARYVEFIESAPGRRFNDAVTSALERVLAEASQRMGERLARDLAPAPAGR